MAGSVYINGGAGLCFGLFCLFLVDRDDANNRERQSNTVELQRTAETNFMKDRLGRRDVTGIPSSDSE
eukprot:3407635-Pyramimonas_sp.AAC.1